MNKELISGNQALVKAALASRATFLAGYPITPTSEILAYWSEEKLKNNDLVFLQTEDEMAAGFAALGAVLVGTKAFVTSAGPGNVLMQDAFSFAENMRLPIVAFIMQRGGPSTGTVIYSQQEVNLTCFGGNGEGLRIVYSTSSPQDLYDYAIKAFNTAWKYRFPTFVLGDGYQSKEETEVELKVPAEIIDPVPYLLNPNKEAKTYANLRNTYNLESELSNLLKNHKNYYDEIAPEIIEYEDLQTLDSDIVIFAHGIVAAVVKEAQKDLRAKGVKVGIFRPITLLPFPTESAKQVIKNKKAILIAESSLGQFSRLLKANVPLDPNITHEFLSPAQGIYKQEIIDQVKKVLDGK